MVAAMLVKSPFSHKALLGLVLADGLVGGRMKSEAKNIWPGLNINLYQLKKTADK
jgi:hypothetical protein